MLGFISEPLNCNTARKYVFVRAYAASLIATKNIDCLMNQMMVCKLFIQFLVKNVKPSSGSRVSLTLQTRAVSIVICS